MEWRTLQEEAQNTLVGINGRFPPRILLLRLLEHQRAGLKMWTKFMAFKFSQTVPQYSDLKCSAVYGGEDVYSHRDSYDSVLFEYYEIHLVGLTEGVLAINSADSASPFRMVLIRLLVPIPPDEDNKNVVHVYGHRRYTYVLSSENVVR